MAGIDANKEKDENENLKRWIEVSITKSREKQRKERRKEE